MCSAIARPAAIESCLRTASAIRRCPSNDARGLLTARAVRCGSLEQLGDLAHQAGEEGGVRGDGDRLVEVFVAGHTALALGDLQLHDRQGVVDRCHLGVAASFGCQFGQLHLKRFPGLDHFWQSIRMLPESPNRQVAHRPSNHDGTVAVANRNYPLNFERHQSLTQRGADSRPAAQPVRAPAEACRLAACPAPRCGRRVVRRSPRTVSAGSRVEFAQPLSHSLSVPLDL